MNRNYLTFLTLVVALALPITVCQGAKLEIIPTPTLNAAPITVSGMSGNGSVLVGYAAVGTTTHAVRWTKDSGTVDLGTVGSDYYSQASATSNDGSVVVGYSANADGTQKAFRWTAATGMVSLGGYAGAFLYSSASDVSADGSVVVGTAFRTPGAKPTAFRWTAATGLVTLGYLNPSSSTAASFANAVSADGKVVTGWSTASFTPRNDAFRWSQSTGMSGMFVDWAYGRDASADGSTIIFGVNGSTNSSFLWTPSTGVKYLSIPGAANVYAFGISGDGSKVVGTYDITGNSTGQGFLWDQSHGTRTLKQALLADYNLDLTAWKSITAGFISTDGNTLFGHGIDSSNQSRNFFIYLPEPGALAALICPVVVCLYNRRRAYK